MARQTKKRLYEIDGEPCSNFNIEIVKWLRKEILVKEHTTPAAFDGAMKAYDTALKVAEDLGLSVTQAHKEVMSNLTKLLFGYDMGEELKLRLNPNLVNLTGFRTTLSQGMAKNVGENFVNLIVYGIAKALSFQDEVLIDKGLPPFLKKAITLKRTVPLRNGDMEIKVPIECDLSIFLRSDPSKVILISAKTRLKEVFHIGTMWKLLFDTLDDPHCLAKWGLARDSNISVSDMLYVFATADMVKEGGTNSQGPDVDRIKPRNLIAMDASFFDYVFVSKSGIPHVENTIDLTDRGALFHELGCIVDLIEKKFTIDLS